jgi:hypothetical protein
LSASLIAIAITLAAFPIALFVVHQRCCCFRHHCPLRRRRRRSPATLVAITIALFITIAAHSPAILFAIAITMPPLPSSLPTTLIAVTLSLFITRQPHRHCHFPSHCRCRCRHHCPHCHHLIATLVTIAFVCVSS